MIYSFSFKLSRPCFVLTLYGWFCPKIFYSKIRSSFEALIFLSSFDSCVSFLYFSCLKDFVWFEYADFFGTKWESFLVSKFVRDNEMILLVYWQLPWTKSSPFLLGLKKFLKMLRNSEKQKDIPWFEIYMFSMLKLSFCFSGNVGSITHRPIPNDETLTQSGICYWNNTPSFDKRKTLKKNFLWACR